MNQGPSPSKFKRIFNLEELFYANVSTVTATDSAAIRLAKLLNSTELPVIISSGLCVCIIRQYMKIFRSIISGNLGFSIINPKLQRFCIYAFTLIYIY